ncbi:hypothetical protein [Flavobacterium ginsengiterrae]|uniref:Phage protein n=1 Tax=Flavobacterium ginsengiterrae TaxID=871695 RepID=A0ABP7H308_9FLAO
MGLTEKRLAESIKTNELPAFQNKINKIAGYELKIVIDWDSFTAFDENPLKRLTSVMFESVEYVIKKICIDEVGKEALKEKLNTIHLINTDDFDSIKMEIKDKNFYLTFQLAAYSYGSLVDSEIVKYIENVL